ncbi:hypothetical protein [Micromonospora sp. IBHARD004]|uniref:hypothetical protein n=1 Tax=Micromonospora sp. IBHARD004 TaxID=3457764 RepID=UPI004058B965
MDRRRITAIGVLVVAAGAAAAVTLPSFAGEGAAPRGGAAAASDGVAPEVVDALSRDLSLSREQAATRLKPSAGRRAPSPGSAPSWVRTTAAAGSAPTARRSPWRWPIRRGRRG